MISGMAAGGRRSGPLTVRPRDPGGQHQLIDLSVDAMFTRSFDDRTITSWNEGAERLYGWTRGEAVGKKAAELLRSRYPIPLEAIEEQLRDTGRWEGDIIQRDKAGRELTVRGRWGLQTDSGGRPLAILEINSDLSLHRQAAQRLLRSEQRFQLLVSAVVEYAIFMLDPTGVIVSWNVGAQRIKGYKAEEIIGKHFSVFYTPEDRARKKPARALQKAVREGQFSGEGWRMRKDGTRFWASVVITALRDDAGALYGFAKVTRDITDRHNEEMRLRDQARQMAELEQAKTQFLDMAAHELRSPLTLIRGYNSMLRDGRLPAERVPQIAELLEDTLEQIDLLVRQMLDMARLENDRLELQIEAIDLCDVAREQIDRLRPLAAGHEITITCEGNALATGDRSRVGTIIGNLLDNAVKYSPSGGGIRCEVGGDDANAYVSVVDRGLGIAPEHVDLLFKRFSRLPTESNQKIKGTGLALYLCQQFALRLGGEITVRSQLGEGSRFTLRLPVAERATMGGRSMS